MVTKYNYQQLKLGKNGLPTWDGLMPVVMEVAQAQASWKSSVLARTVADSIGLPDNLRQLSYANRPEADIIENRVQWALSDLALSGLLRRPSRGLYVVTDTGMRLYAQYGSELTAEICHRQPAYLAHQQEVAARKRKLDQTPLDSDDEQLPGSARVKQIQRDIENYNTEVEADLLERIREAEPTFFEHLVADLLTAMGYQGPDGKVVVTPPTHDGGIDGTINQDPLGTSTVYYQAKRYQVDNIVQRPAIEGFYGALSRVHADRGVFISTSSFSKGAQETAKGFSIVLIDGVQLTSLLLHYHVGVQPMRIDELFQIDEDYFD